MSNEKYLDILRAPLVTEKTAQAGEYNQYAFKVAKSASKPEIKSAVEEIFEVRVTNIQTVNAKGKSRGFRGVRGRRSDWKKAYVTLAEGQTIDFGLNG